MSKAPVSKAWVGLDDPRPVVVSWGAGVQSKAIGLLVERGELPRPAAWVWADTGGEPAAIYRDVERWAPRLQALGGFHVVKHPRETLTEHATNGGGGRIPMHVVADDGRRGPIPHRGCTRDFKILPIDRLTKAQFGGVNATVSWQGISLDEARRCKPNGRTCYPLLELRWSRTRCLELLREAGEPLTRSACVFCPYRSDAEWRTLEPADLAVAEAVEAGMVASIKGLRSVPSLHISGVPVKERPWDAVGGEQLDLVGGDCGGSCFT